MLTFTRIGSVARDQYDHVYAPVRSMRHPSPWITQVKALSPSSVLLSKYLTLKEDGKWGPETFRAVYVPEFLDGIRHDPEACAWLNYFVRQDLGGANLALVCFCPDETICHRSILAGLLAGAGCDVRTDGMEPDRSYYQKFLQIP